MVMHWVNLMVFPLMEKQKDSHLVKYLGYLMAIHSVMHLGLMMAYLQMERLKVMPMGFRWANQKGSPTDYQKAMKMDYQRA